MGDAAMRKLSFVLPALLLAGSFLSPAVSAQIVPPSSGVQRAPGVPPAPRPAELDRRRMERDGAAQPGLRGPDTRAQASTPQPERDPPMPRGVPSIIAP